jgi:predicted solute-binding protein
LFRIEPAIESRSPDLSDMLAHSDAALIIGDTALFLDPLTSQPGSVSKIDLGEAWKTLTGMPFVYAFWAGRPGALRNQDVAALQKARDEGVTRPEELAREYLAGTPERQRIGADYLRDNIKYYFGDEERAGLESFYRYAVEAGVVPDAGAIRLY